ncbi:hypothetical protein SAMN00768000_3095 [Sulfobacillus thermosulfidooxidans DSM 9293]|uniref:Uncharacterized protein n=1 Tax=Sulfobacillus thermosulfidooxidans (strain DSM 9293 / VKM B-1269 / AT-1) TaxID=929705 RepID=A0A1W1WKV2_SULTA|nr:hypothetical protein [Sulfobacillus thermosulfidooxidans]SMC06907.1 hypothetical protein SAMN00768000_3095 [Sulfobacillus thermosulfidooxidans DSM 9293]
MDDKTERQGRKAGKKRVFRFALYLTAPEEDLVRQTAEREHVSVSAFVRTVVLQYCEGSEK